MFNNDDYFYNKVKSSVEVYVHSKNVADITLYILYKHKADLSVDQLFEVYYGCLIHDIGKTKIPSRILNKQQKLLPEEREIIMNHSAIGYDIIKDSIKSEIIISIVRDHHEKLDGSGYGSGILDISNISQVVTIADMYEGITHARSYRKAFTHEEAMDLLMQDVKDNKINKEYVKILENYNKEQQNFLQMIEIIAK